MGYQFFLPMVLRWRDSRNEAPLLMDLLWKKTSRDQWLIICLDFHKALDSVEWNYLVTRLEACFWTIVEWGFCDIQNNQGWGRGYQPKAEFDNPYRDLDYSGYHKNRI